MSFIFCVLSYIAFMLILKGNVKNVLSFLLHKSAPSVFPIPVEPITITFLS